MDEEERINEEIAHLVEAGALILYGMDKDEPVYHIVPEVMKQISPELYEIMMEELDDVLLSLYRDGLVEVEYDENLRPRFGLTEEGKRLANEVGFYRPDNQE